MMKCVILDDEPFAHQVLEYYIKQSHGLQLERSFRNAIEAFEYLEKYDCDILFLDVEMPLINGVSFLRALKNKPKTIFTTAFKEYAFDGFELGAVDYLLKPFTFERFSIAVDKIKATTITHELITRSILIKVQDGLLRIPHVEILYIESYGDYIKIITFTAQHLIYHTLKNMLEKLHNESFIQVHRSFVVNSTLITKIQSDQLILSNKVAIPLGNSYKKGLLEKLGD